jgi:hypothetical protein
MKRVLKIAGFLLALVVLLAAFPGYRLYVDIRKALSEDPAAWAEDVADLVAETREGPVPKDAVVFIGSSSIRLWSTLEHDMRPLPVIQHGFGGAKLADVEFYAERLVSQFTPGAVVVFAGTNDLRPRAKKSPTVLLKTYQRFVERVRSDLPNVSIYFIGITPSPRRWEIWDQALETNRLVREWSERNPALFYIETGPALLAEDGEPDADNYMFDGVHLSAQGYAIWTEIIRTRLMEDLRPAPQIGISPPGLP